MNAAKTTTLVLIVLITVSAYASAPAPLGNNPFDRPATLAVVGATTAALSDSTAGRLIELRSTMVGPNTMLADVGGRILRPGDVYGEFKLLRVFEDRATFAYGDNVVTVLVKPPTEDTDD